jgi:hypothetical protein
MSWAEYLLDGSIYWVNNRSARVLYSTSDQGTP